jgi:uncharacterized protein YyaL (SSP411 family)
LAQFAANNVCHGSPSCRYPDFQNTNHLANEKSPYSVTRTQSGRLVSLSAEADARREQKPILLSIGYSIRPVSRDGAGSFSDPAIAELMNRSFVSIADREERPDIDRVHHLF